MFSPLSTAVYESDLVSADMDISKSWSKWQGLAALAVYSVTIIALDRVYVEGSTWKSAVAWWKRYLKRRRDDPWMNANTSNEIIFNMLAKAIPESPNPCVG